MSFNVAETNRVGLRYSLETNWGETPSTPTMQILRFIGESLKYNKQTAISEEIRTDRNVPDIIETGVNVDGGINIEFSSKTYEDFLQACLCGTWVTGALSALSLTVAAAAKTITRAAGSWVSDGVVVGMWVFPGGLTNPGNNKYFRVTNVTATVLTVEDPEATLVDEGPTAACTLNFKMLRNGTTKRSFLIEKAFTDISKFIHFTGCRVGQFDLDLTAQAIAKGAFTLMGKDGTKTTTTISGSTTAATTTDVFSASASVGALVKNGVNLTEGIKSLKITVTANLRHQPIVGSKFDNNIAYGRNEVKGSADVYISDMALFDDVIAHNTIMLYFPIVDAAGNIVIFTIPAIKLTGDPSAPAGNQDVMMAATWEAKLDPTTACMIQVDVFDAA